MEKRNKKLYILSFLLLILTIIVYLPSLNQGIISDDYILLRNISVTTPFEFKYYYPAIYPFRPNFVSQYSLSFDKYLWGEKIWGFHLTNIILHVIVVLLLFTLLNLLTKNLELSFWIALIFSIHPIKPEVVTWISGRQDLLSAMFLLISLIMAEKNRFIISGISFALSCFSKEMGLITPVIYLIIIFLWKRDIKKYENYGIGLSLILIFYLYIKFAVFGVEANHSMIIPLITIIKTYFLYISIFIYYPLSSFPQSVSNLTIFPIILSILFISLILKFRKDREIMFGFLFFTISILPVLNIIPVPDYIPHSDRFLYIPSMGLSISFIYILSKIKKNYIFFTLIIIMLIPITVKREFLFGNYNSLVKNSLIYNEKNEAALYLAGRINSIKKPKIALKNFKEAIKLSPYKNIWFYTDLINLELSLNRLKEAQNEIDIAKKIFGKNGKILLLEGKLFKKLNRKDIAIKKFAEGEKLEKRNVEILYNISSLLIECGNLKEGTKVLKRALNISPWKYVLNNNYAIALTQSGNIKNGLKYIKKALKLIKNDKKIISKNRSDKLYIYAVVLNNYAALLRKSGNLKRAISLMKKSYKIFESSKNKGGLSLNIFRDNLSIIDKKDINMIYFQMD